MHDNTLVCGCALRWLGELVDTRPTLFASRVPTCAAADGRQMRVNLVRHMPACANGTGRCCFEICVQATMHLCTSVHWAAGIAQQTAPAITPSFAVPIKIFSISLSVWPSTRPNYT
jgi:hypothetical protein